MGQIRRDRTKDCEFLKTVFIPRTQWNTKDLTATAKYVKYNRTYEVRVVGPDAAGGISTHQIKKLWENGYILTGIWRNFAFHGSKSEQLTVTLQSIDELTFENRWDEQGHRVWHWLSLGGVRLVNPKDS